MTRAIVQIPCYNEARTLPRTIADIPRDIDGVDSVEILVIDDGSDDETSRVARLHGADHVVRHTRNRGLAASFRTGIDTCIRLGADIIVNTDGDNQYRGEDIGRLVQPILDREADIVLGDRQTHAVSQFSPLKRWLQRWGSFMVRTLSGLDVPDAVTGFRAFSRQAAMELNVVSSFSYTIETLIQAGRMRLAVQSVPVRTNPHTRPSRLFRNIPQFLFRSGTTMMRMYAMYNPLRVFLALGIIPALTGLLPILRFVFYFLQGNGDGHIQSLILGATLLLIGFFIILIGLVADLISCNRRLIEQNLARVRVLEANTLPEPAQLRPHTAPQIDQPFRELATNADSEIEECVR